MTLTPEILIYGDIGDEVTAKEVIQQLEALKSSPEIKVRINSDGGSVSQGAAIYKALKDHPSKIITAIEGGAFSIAGYIAMAGDVREIASNGMLMIHGPRTETIGTEETHEQTLQMLKAAKTSMVTAYVEATGETEEQIREMLTRDNWFSAEQALSRGFVTNISGESKLAAKYLDPSKFETIPKRFAEAIRRTKIVETFMTATIKELKASCPGATADFILAQAEKEATVVEAQAEHTKALAADNATLKAKLAAMDEEDVDAAKSLAALTAENAELKAAIKAMEEGSEESEEEEEESTEATAKKTGANAVANVSSGGSVGSARAKWNAAVEKNIEKGMPNAKAVSMANKKNPGLREQMLKEANAT